MEIVKRGFENPELRNKRIGKKSKENAKINPNYGMRNKHHSERSKKKMSLSHKGKHLSEETKSKLSKSLKGRIFSNKTKERMSSHAKNRFRDKENHPKYGTHHSKETKLKLSLAKLGEKNPMKKFKTRKKLSATYLGIKEKDWVGFSNYHSITNGKLSKKDKDKIKKIYNYTCQLCKIFSKDKIEIHHIDYNVQNNNLDNLIVLCKKCHHKTNRNRKYWENYLK